MWDWRQHRLEQREPHNNADQQPHSLPRHVDLAQPAFWPDISSLDLGSSSFQDIAFDVVPSINISSPSMFDSCEELSS